MTFQSAVHDSPVPTPWLRKAERLRLAMLGCAYGSTERNYQLRTLRHRLSVASLWIGISVLAWIPIDLNLLATEAAQPVLTRRIALATLLLLMSWYSRNAARALAAYPLLLLFVGAQCVLFAAMQASLPETAPPLLRLGYGLLPFIVGAQLALFPLPASATAMMSLPILVWVLMPAPVVAPFAGGLAQTGSLWLLALIVAVAAWAGAAQLALLQSLLQAREDAAHDALTGLANQRMALDRLDADVAHARRDNAALAVLALDLDRFKRINEEHGHSGGDRVLLELARVLDSELRAYDFAARIGGEEFIAILPGATRATGALVAERIRERCEALAVRGDIRFTVSIGVATLLPDEDGDHVLARAIQAVHIAKSEGRNRVSLHE